MKVIVFDIGGTLMEYIGMPLSWVDYYKTGLQAVNERLFCNVTEDDIQKSVEILKSYNPRVNYREVEYTPEFIFQNVLADWNYTDSVNDAVNIFYNGLKLTLMIYDDTIPVLSKLRENGYKIAVLTDLPTAMPDEFFKRDIAELLEYIDFYVSSLSCGYRKPNPSGLHLIAEKYGVSIENIIFVGDEEKDRQTAVNAGCQFVQINRNGNVDDGINNLCSLLKTILEVN